MRTFIALDIDNKLKNKINDMISSIECEDVDIKYVNVKNLHITLKFLGEMNELNVNNIKKLLDDFSFFKKFKMSIKDVGFFGNSDHIRTLWIGIDSGKEKLKILSLEINNRLSGISGFDKFSPHITFGRVKTSRNKDMILEWVKQNEYVNIGEMDVTEFKIKKSTLTSQGPIYEDIETIKLG